MKQLTKPNFQAGFSIAGTQVMDANARKTQTLFCNSGRASTASGYAAANDGTFTLAHNISAAKLVIPIHGLKAGDQITGFTVRAALGATTGLATVLDADLRKVTPKSDGTSTDASVGAVTQVSVTANELSSPSKTVTAETVATTYQYYVLVTGTTANNSACKQVIAGVEVAVNRK
jgi:hypothetical protein